MKNQPNDIVTLEWLLPLFDQQLSQISDGWQLEADIASYEQMISYYHQISGALIMVRLPLLAGLANKLGLLASLGDDDSFSSKDCRIGQFSHKLLQRELNYYTRTGNYHVAVIDKAAYELTQVLSQRGIATELIVDDTDAQHEYLGNGNIDDSIIKSIEVTVPITEVTTRLVDQQYQQLLLVWRQQVQKLLTANANQPSVLSVLEKVVQYLWQTTQDRELQRLWYLTQLWLNDLAHNDTPLLHRQVFYCRLLYCSI